jgi:hypothetical protein
MVSGFLVPELRISDFTLQVPYSELTSGDFACRLDRLVTFE